MSCDGVFLLLLKLSLSLPCPGWTPCLLILPPQVRTLGVLFAINLCLIHKDVSLGCASIPTSEKNKCMIKLKC